MTTASSAPLILIVEDEPALRDDIIEELQEAGYRTLAAADGKAARDVLDEITPDLVLCDITMPKLDGYGLLAALQAERPDLAAMPFVFLTAMSEPQEVIAGKLQGADDYLVKPVDYDLLLATVATRIRQVARIRDQHEAEIAKARAALIGLSGGGPEQALDLIALGIVLLDAQGSIVHANRAARGMAQTSEYFSIRGAVLRATDPMCDKALQQAIGEAQNPGTAERDAIRGVMLHGNGQAISALICTLAPEAHGTQPRVALFVSPPNQVKKVSEQLLIELFDLTPTEARVAASLTRGARPADVADALGVSQTTIAFHLRNLFQKTGTNRQTDLVALILAGPMAVETS